MNNSRNRSHLQRPGPSSSLLPLTGILKRSVSDRLMREFGERLPKSLYQRALDDAEAVAHSTDFPNLFFPELAEEKVRLVSTAIAADFQGHSTLSRAA